MQMCMRVSACACARVCVRVFACVRVCVCEGVRVRDCMEEDELRVVALDKRF